MNQKALSVEGFFMFVRCFFYGLLVGLIIEV